jgi:imidazolonepropionase-like amidohydrolase
MEMGITPGPRLVLSGRPLAIIGGHLSYFGVQATGPDECRAAVRQLFKEGADFVKITATGGSTLTSSRFRPSFDMDELKAIVQEAHKFGKHAAAHCASSQGIINALDAGVDTVIHGYHREPDGAEIYRPEITERVVSQGTFLNPTLHQGRESAWQLEAKQESGGLTQQEQAELDEFRKALEIRSDHVSRMRDEGVRLVCGSDSAWAYYPMAGFQKEIDSHVEIGMSPMEAIVSATSESARSCWTDNEVGSLEPGKQADVLVVDGDPTKDIAALKHVVDVFQAGKLVDRGSYV